MSLPGAPVPEQIWASTNATSAPGVPVQEEPVATEPLKRVTSESEINEETVYDKEAVEESQSDEGTSEKPRREPLARSGSNWTGTSMASSLTETPNEDAGTTPHKRSIFDKLNPLKSRRPPPVPKERKVSREYGANLFSILTFQWMSPIMQVGYQRPLELNDIWLVNPNRSTDVLAERMKVAFKARVDRGDEKPLRGALYDTFRTEFLIGGACELTASVVGVLSPYVLKYLITFATEAYEASHYGTPAPSIGHGVGLVIGVTLLQMLQSMTTNHFLYRGMTVGGQARAVLISVIFEKSMKISGRAKAGGMSHEAPPTNVKPGSQEERSWFKKRLGKDKPKPADNSKSGVSGDGQGWSNGRIVNLMSMDTYRVDQASGWFHMIWASPISVVLTLVLLLVNLTYSALPGFGLLMFTTPLLGTAIKSLFMRRKAINKITDQRVSLTQEILQGVRFVKYFGWETSFLDRLAEIRRREISKVQVVLSIRNLIMAIGMSMPVFASMLAFITYKLSNHGLVAANIFSSLALFNSLRMPLNLLPMVIGQVVDASASLRRIQEFLLAEEAEDPAVWDPENKSAIVVDNASFAWERSPTHDPDKTPGKDPRTAKQMKEEKKADKKAQKEKKKEEHRLSKLTEQDLAEKDTAGASSSSDTLTDGGEERPFEIKDMDLSFGRNELVAVIGTVGSGKSSLLGALAGDMRKTGGTITLGASRAFCPQYAWIQNATLKENIVFGKEYKKRWYNDVIDACALRPDLEMLPNGDLTEIGERGITVSGGQKQRLNIARAIYFDADIILMDDPLSAVDAHVGRHIMDNAICGLLKDKCRVLATHQLHVLHRCDRIIWMEEGRIRTVDTFPNLMASDEDFRKMMATTNSEEAKEEVDDEDEQEDEKKDAKKRKGGRKPGAALMQIEERAVKSVSVDVYWAYIKNSGTWLNAPLIIVLLIISQGANITTSLWLSWWTSDKFHYSTGKYIGAYAALGFTQALTMFVFSVTLTYCGTQSSKVMLHRAVTRVLRAPMSFFDTTPLGRITNRFSKDVDTMDNSLTDSFRMFFMTTAQITAVFILIIAYFYYFAVALGPLLLMFLFSASYYRASAREIKRHESVLRSTVFSRFSEAVNGIATIRAYGLQKQFSDSVREAVDTMNGAYFLTMSNQRWLSTRLDAIGNLLVFTVGVLVVTSRFSINPSISGLVLSYILSIVQMIQFTVRQLAEVENNMNSTERIHYYGTQLEEEAPLHTVEVRPTWPEKGEIVFQDVQMRYRAGLPLVLQGLSMHVAPGERIGVVGRTGAGKSSIMSTLFRLIELSGGSITIDGLDIGKVGLRDLRSRLSIIPQDPTLFRGTVRSNLDPFNEHTDLELWSALRQADLVGENQSMEDKGPNTRINLDATVEEEGLNFSLGQRQLMALARALVRGSRIIVCDEATSSVDFETDRKIQQTIVRGFEGKTLLCIAHRLKTIIGYDRICVMDAGRIAELDTPLALFEKGGIFRGMCDRSGIRRADFGEMMQERLQLEDGVAVQSEGRAEEVGDEVHDIMEGRA